MANRQKEREGGLSKCYLTITTARRPKTWVYKTGNRWLVLVLRAGHRFRVSQPQPCVHWCTHLWYPQTQKRTVTTQTGRMGILTHNLKTSPWFGKKGLWFNWVSHPYYRHFASGGPLNVRMTLFNGEFHAHLLNWPKCIVWLCLIRQTAGFSPCGYIVPASLLLGFTEILHFSFCSHEFPLGINTVARGFEVCVLTRPITVWQPLVRIRSRHYIVTSV